MHRLSLRIGLLVLGIAITAGLGYRAYQDERALTAARPSQDPKSHASGGLRTLAEGTRLIPPESVSSDPRPETRSRRRST